MNRTLTLAGKFWLGYFALVISVAAVCALAH